MSRYDVRNDASVEGDGKPSCTTAGGTLDKDDDDDDAFDFFADLPPARGGTWIDSSDGGSTVKS